MSPPKYSIGVTAYGRMAFIKDALNSILSQGVKDFEILIGNDDPSVHLDEASLGIDDHRVRIFNHPNNLGQTENINFLIAEAKGEYFCWIADDDYFAPEYLVAMDRAIGNFQKPCVVFSSYHLQHGETLEFPKMGQISSGRAYQGTDFLNAYFQGKIRVIGFYGMFALDWLKSIHGVRSFTNYPVSLFAEYWILVECGSLERVVFLDSPLVCYRFHRDVGALLAPLEHIDRAAIHFIESMAAHYRFHHSARLLFRHLLRMLHLFYASHQAQFLKAETIPSWKAFIRYLAGCLSPIRRVPGFPCKAVFVAAWISSLWRPLTWRFNASVRSVCSKRLLGSLRKIRDALGFRSAKPFWN
jgi:glycosyltransferase involved in cell wall biosynthesis